MKWSGGSELFESNRNHHHHIIYLLISIVGHWLFVSFPFPTNMIEHVFDLDLAISFSGELDKLGSPPNTFSSFALFLTNHRRQMITCMKSVSDEDRFTLSWSYDPIWLLHIAIQIQSDRNEFFFSIYANFPLLHRHTTATEKQKSTQNNFVWPVNYSIIQNEPFTHTKKKWNKVVAYTIQHTTRSTPSSGVCWSGRWSVTVCNIAFLHCQQTLHSSG